MHIESYLNNALTGVPLPGQAPTANANAGGIAIDPSLLDDEDLPHPSAIGSSVNRRRRRSELGEDTDEVANYEQRLSRLLHFAEESMDRHNLEGESRNAVRKMAELDLAEQMIELMVVMTKKQVETSAMATKTFCRSHTYSTHVVNRLKVALLAPFLISYVTPLQEWILRDIQQHPQAWRLPEEIVNDSTQWTEFASVIKTKLTQQLAAWKALIAKLYHSNSDINSIMIRLCPKQMVISEGHRARWAFISRCYADFEGLVEQGTEQSCEFWEYIGKQLEHIKREIAAHPSATTPEARRNMMNAVFEHALVEHRVAYPTYAGVGPLGDRPAWQETLETAMELGAAV